MSLITVYSSALRQCCLVIHIGIEKSQCARHSLVWGPPWLGLEKNLQNKGPRKAGKRYFEIGCCKCSISLESYFIYLLRRVYRNCVRHSFISRVYYRAHHGWAWRKIFKIKVLGRLENAILRLVVANAVFH